MNKFKLNSNKIFFLIKLIRLGEDVNSWFLHLILITKFKTKADSFVALNWLNLGHFHLIQFNFNQLEQINLKESTIIQKFISVN
jgi:hypothetical protein